MDMVLELIDELVLDRFWAWAVPALPRSLAGMDSAELAAVASGSQMRGRGAFSKVAQPTSSAIANLTAHLANAWIGHNRHLGTSDAATDGVAAAAAAASSAASGAEWEALRGVSAWGRDHIIRQCVSLLSITYVGIFVLYFGFASLSYWLFFNHDMKKHPRFLKNQVRLEIEASLRAFIPLDFMTLPWFVAEVRGHSMLYDNISDYGWGYALFSIAFFLLFTDACIYWVHRMEHHPKVYKHIHKPHHKWLVPTPFASHAFHPVDGYLQSLPYHLFVFLFPLHRFIYIGLFVFVNCWSILIHDSDMICNSPLEKVINGPSHHTLHHLYFTVNYGQYFTGCDRLGGSYRAPRLEDDPLNDVLKEGKKVE